MQATQISHFLKKYQTPLFFFFIFILGILFFKNSFAPKPLGDWVSCVDYLKQGILYQGELRCYHGPLNYFLLYGLIGLFPQTYLFIFQFLVLASAFLLLLLIWKTIQILELKHYYFLLALLFFVFVYLPSIDNDSGDTIYGTLFFFTGSYLLFFSKHPLIKYALSSFLFTLALFTRLNVLIPLALVLAYYFKDFLIKENKLSFSYTTIKPFLFMIVPSSFFILLFVFLFPKIIKYSILSQFIVEPYSLLLKIHEFFSEKLFLKLFFLLVSIGLSLWGFLKKRTVYSFVALFGFLLLTYATLRGHHGYFQRYYIPLFPFFIIAATLLLNSLRQKYARITLIFFLLLFSLVGVKLVAPHLTSPEFYELQDILGAAFFPISEQPGRYLLDNTYLLRYLPVDLHKIDILPDKYNIDKAGAQRLNTLGLVSPQFKDVPSQRYVAINQYQEINKTVQKILQKEYSVVIIGPKNIYSPVKETLRYYLEIEKKISFNMERWNKGDIPNQKEFGFTCFIDFLSLQDSCPNCVFKQAVFFTNITQNKCNRISANLITYYFMHTERICQLDEQFADYINTAVSPYIHQPIHCQSGRTLLKKIASGNIATVTEGLWISAGFLLILLYYFYIEKDHE